MPKLTNVNHEQSGKVHIHFGKDVAEFSSVEHAQSWCEDVLSRTDVQRAILIRRALKATAGTLKPVKACRGFRVDVNLDADSPVEIAKDAE